MSVSSLCQSCALCCDGSLFATVPLQEHERAGEGAASFAQPCADLSGSACSRYSTRPAACRKFTCLLAGALAEGEVDDEEARARVDEAKALIARVAAQLPVMEAPGSVMQRARQLQEPSPSLALSRDAAESFLRRHFLGRHRR